MRDEIMRLASVAESESMRADMCGKNARLARRERLEKLAAELRALARKTGENSGDFIKSSYPEFPDNSVDGIGAVPSGWRNKIVAIERNSEYDTDLQTDTPILILRFASVSLRESANPLAKGWVDRGLVVAALAQPADADAEGGK